MSNQALQLYRRDIKIDGASFDNNDLRRLFGLVQSQLAKAVELQIGLLNPELTTNVDQLRSNIKEALVLTYSIKKPRGDEISGNGQPDLSDNNLPDHVASIYISTKEPFEFKAGFPPRNHVALFIDFQRARLSVDFITMPSNPTNNGSVVNVIGCDEHWVIETYTKLKEFFDGRHRSALFIHRSGIYDLYLYVFVIPVYLYVFGQFEVAHPSIIDRMPRITLIAIYVYSFFIVGVIGRLSFQYLRWLFPLVEYTEDKRGRLISAQRVVFITICLSLIGSAIYDFIKFAF